MVWKGPEWLRAPFRAMRFKRKARRASLHAGQAAKARAATSAKVIAVTGSSGKSTTVGLISHILSAENAVATLVYKNVLADILTIFRTARTDPAFFVLELGVGRIGDMKPMADLARPDVAVVTLVGREHYSAFRGREAVAREKSALVAALAPGGLAVLNADDDLAMGMAGLTAERVVTFGRNEAANYRVVAAAAGFPERLALTIEAGGETTTVRTQFPGEHHRLAVAAAFATAAELGIDRDTIARRIGSFQPSMTRARIVPVPGGPTFIVDTAKAPYDTLGLAFDMIARATAPRRRIVLGQISDFPGASKKTYRAAYAAARAASDEVVFVGENSHRSNASPEDCESGRFLAFSTPREVAEHIRRTCIPGELILLKGSGNLHLERIAFDWLAEIGCWVPACGLKEDCVQCGRYGLPFERHLALRKRERHRSRLRRLIFLADKTGPYPLGRRFDGPADAIGD